MAIQVVQVPNPAAGAEWAYTIPGQYVATLIGVQATLRTGTGVTSFPDESGNGNTAILSTGSNGFVLGAPGPYAGGLNNYCVDHNRNETGINQACAVTAQMVAAGPATFTLEAWAYVTQLSINQGDMMGLTSPSFGAEYVAMSVKSGGADPYTLRANHNNAGDFDVTNVAARNAWHLIAITWDGASWRFYRDGTLLLTQGGFAPSVSAQPYRTHVGGNRFFGTPLGYVGACAIYGAALSAGQLAAHAAANGSWAAYRAAVLADSPLGFWGLNTVNSGPSRTVVLGVQNGAQTVAVFPATNPGTTQVSFTYSWQVLGPGAAQTTDGTTITVPIPAMTLPPGYRIGSNTLDIVSTDQWSDVIVWYDDGTGTPGPGGGAPPYLDALLVPTDWKGGG